MTVRVPAIQSLISPHVASVYTSQIPIDWVNGKVYPYDSGTFNVSRVNISTGVVEANGAFEPPDFFPPVGIDRAGVLYNKPGTGNFSSVLATRASDFLFLGTFGVSSAGDNQPNSIPGPAFFFANSMGPDIIWIATAASIPFGTSQHSVNILRGGGVPAFGGHNFEMTGGVSSSHSQCPGPASSSSCQFFTTETLGSSAQVNIYTTTIQRLAITYDSTTWPTPNPYIGTIHTGTIIPTAINPAYHHFIQSGVIWDQTDNNLILGINAGTGGIPNAFIIKATPAGAVLWKVPWPGAPLSFMMGGGSTRHGRYAVAFCNSFTKEVLVINTADGSVETITSNLQGLSLTGEQCYNDDLGCIIAELDFGTDSDGPIVLGNTPPSFSGWAALYVTNAEPIPYVPGGRVTYTRIWGAPAGV
jgi:hypothetical protein